MTLYLEICYNLAIDYSEMQAEPEYDAPAMAVRRGGLKPVESTQAEVQTNRERSILSVQYMTVREIPPSPEEPPVEDAVESSGSWSEIPVPEKLRIGVRFNFPTILLLAKKRLLAKANDQHAFFFFFIFFGFQYTNMCHLGMDNHRCNRKLWHHNSSSSSRLALICRRYYRRSRSRRPRSQPCSPPLRRRSTRLLRF